MYGHHRDRHVLTHSFPTRRFSDVRGADRPLAVWQESFVPMRLADALREVDGSNGQPLVLAEEQILPHRIAPEPAETSRPWWPWALAGLAIAVADRKSVV